MDMVPSVHDGVRSTAADCVFASCATTSDVASKVTAISENTKTRLNNRAIYLFILLFLHQNF